jgi:hypothetical protein
MAKLTIILTLLSILAHSYSQNVLDFKEKSRLLHRFWKNETIAFQLKDKEWQKGDLIRIQHDSIYVRPRILQPNMLAPGGADTMRYETTGYSLSEIYAIPKRGILIHNVNGHFEVAMDAGHQHWYWVKSGWLFSVSGAGYAALRTINGIIKSDLSIANRAVPLGIAAGAFGFGLLLKKTYKFSHHLGKRYHLDVFTLQ